MKALARLFYSNVGTCILLLSAPTALPQAGSTDTNYLADVDGSVRSIALQPDGKLVIAGEFRSVGSLARQGAARLNPDGSLDPEFDTGIDWGYTLRMLLQPDGKVVLAGNFQRKGVSLPQLLRVMPNGALDINFVSDPTFDNRKFTLAQQPDGKLLLARDSGLCRLLPNGSLDTNFVVMSTWQNQTNEDGSISTATLTFSALAVLADGKILVGGDFRGVFGPPVTGLIRLHADGTLDRDFPPATNWLSECLAIQPDGCILSGGSTLYGPGTVRRLHPNGRPDPTFPPEAVFNGQIKAIALQPDGKIVAAGYFSDVNGLPRKHIARLNSDGTLDRGFDARVSSQIDAVVVQTNGAVLIGGWFDGHLLRLLGDDSAFPGRLEFPGPVYQVDESGGSVVVPVCRYGGSNGTVTVHYEAAAGSATPGADFVPQSGTLTFAPGQSSNFFVVPILEDSLPEGYPNDERIGLALSAPTGGAILGSLNEAVVSILDNDCGLAFTSSLYTGLEATGRVAVTVIRFGYSGSTVSAACLTSNLTALAGVNYLGGTNIFTLAPGETNRTLLLTLLDDGLMAGEKRFAVLLRQPQGATLGSPSNTVVRIVDDAPGAPDPAFTSQSGYSSTLAVMAGGEFLTLPFNVVRCHANGTLDTDFHPPPDPTYYHRTLALQPDGKVVIGPNSSQGPFRLNPDGSMDQSFTAVLGRTLDCVRVQTDGKLLVGAWCYSVGLARLNSDGTVDTIFNPGPLATNPVRTIVVQPDGKILCARTAQTGDPVSSPLVRLQPDGSLDPGFNSPLTIYDRVDTLALQTDGRILVGAQLSLSPASYHYGLIRLHPDGSLDTDFTAAGSYGASPALAVQAGGKILVGAYGAVLRLNSDGTRDLTFDTGLGPSDGYTSREVAAIAFQPDGGVLVCGGFNLMNGIACAGIALLQNDDHSAAGEVSLDLRTSAVSESASNVVVAVTRSGGSNGVVVVPFTTIDGTAHAGTDYVAQSGVVIFADGDVTEKVITVPLVPDALPEGDETLSISLGTPVGGAAWGRKAKVTATIVDDDVTIQLAETQLRAYEHSLGQALMIQRLGQTATTVSVNYATVDVTALAGFDYIAREGTLTFRPGQTNKTIQLPIVDDRLAERDETFTFRLLGVSSGAVFGTNIAAVVTIIDDDHAGMLDPSFDGGSALCGGTVYEDNEVFALLPQANGRVLVGGNMQSIQGMPCSGLARFLHDGALDAEFALTPNSGFEAPAVRRLGLQADGRAVFAARQSYYAPDTCYRVFADGMTDSSFGPVRLNQGFFPGAMGRLETLVVQGDDKILIAGTFNTVNDVERYNISRLNPNGSLDTAFTPPQKASPYAYNEPITCMVLSATGKVLIGGKFTVTNTTPCFGLARLNSDGSFDSSFNPGTGLADLDGMAVPWGDVNASAIAVQPDGRILVGGTFMQVNGFPRTNIARLNPDGSLDTDFRTAVSWDEGLNPAGVWTIVLQPDNRILVGGRFNRVNGQLRPSVARLLPDGSLDESFSSGDVGDDMPFVRALALEPQGGVLVGGRSLSLGGFLRCGIARLQSESAGMPYDGRPWFTSLARHATGTCTLFFIAPPGQGCTVEATWDFVQWTMLGSATELGDYYFKFQDLDASAPKRFYRIVSP